MVAVTSVMLPLGTKAPAFDLPDVVTGERHTRGSVLAGKKALLLMFICRHCPYVVHVQDELARLGRDYTPQDVAILAISANDAEQYPADAPESLAAMVEEQGFVFPLCYDESQVVAKAYDAACTPDFFLFDADAVLVYRGQLDDSRPSSNTPVTGSDLRRAIDALLSGEGPLPESEQKPSLGCNIKWKS